MEENKSQLEIMIEKYEINKINKKIISLAQKKFNTKKYQLEGLLPLDSLIFIKNINKQALLMKSQDKNSSKKSEIYWGVNQFRLFLWLCLFIEISTKLQINQFSDREYELLSQIFSNKPIIFLQYHLANLLHQTSKQKQYWQQKQTQTFKNEVYAYLQITNEDSRNIKWIQISFNLFVASGKQFFKTPQKCRQFWFNHLNPSLLRKCWTFEEDLQIFKYIKQHGMKWSLLAKMFKYSRTQHMIKNRYKSLLKRYRSSIRRSSGKAQLEFIISELQKQLSKQKFEQIQQNKKQLTQQESHLSKLQHLIDVENQNVNFQYNLQEQKILSLPPFINQATFQDEKSLQQLMKSYEEIFGDIKSPKLYYQETQKNQYDDDYINQLLL